MNRHRLERLARLTTGAALIGASALVGCNNDPKAINAPDPQPHPNATAQPEPTHHVNATAEPAASTSAAPSFIPRRVNAPPQK